MPSGVTPPKMTRPNSPPPFSTYSPVAPQQLFNSPKGGGKGHGGDFHWTPCVYCGKKLKSFCRSCWQCGTDQPPTNFGNVSNGRQLLVPKEAQALPRHVLQAESPLTRKDYEDFHYRSSSPFRNTDNIDSSCDKMTLLSVKRLSLKRPPAVACEINSGP